ncbi:hypothetical protein IOD13_06710 [Brevibacterium casei]|nr:hypothetical protein [Brevibacterium casei]
MSPLSRSSLRRGITAAALTGALVLLSSCGSSGSSADAEPAQTRTVTTAEGPVEVPVDPRRIVVLNYAPRRLPLRPRRAGRRHDPGGDKHRRRVLGVLG